jgi:hypothetical protein
MSPMISASQPPHQPTSHCLQAQPTPLGPTRSRLGRQTPYLRLGPRLPPEVRPQVH